MKTFWNKTNVPLILVIIISTALVIFCGIIFMMTKNLNNDISKTASSIDSEIKKNSVIESLRKLSKETLVDRKKIDSYLIERDNVVGFIEKIEVLGSMAGVGVEISSVSLSPMVDKNNQFLNLGINISGSWQNTSYLLTLLENMPIQLNINSMETSLETIETGNSWSSNLNISVLIK